MNTVQSFGAAQAQKPTKFVPINTPRWFNGLYTNRSPFRMSSQSHLVERFYGPDGDILIDGLNTELTPRLTLARRPGNPVWNTQSFPNTLRIGEFRLFQPSPSIEQILTLFDTSTAFYVGSQQSSPTQTGDSLNLQKLIWTKSTGAGRTSNQAVGNTLYFGNGLDQKKWLNTLTLWAGNTAWNVNGNNPFMTTFFIDPNGNIQQLTGTALSALGIAVDVNNLVTVTVGSGQIASSNIAVGNQVVFHRLVNATFLNGIVLTVQSINNGTGHFTANSTTFTHAVYGNSDSGVSVMLQGGTPVSQSSAPTWSTTVLTPTLGAPDTAATYEGTVQWTNRGSQIENWGIKPPIGIVSPSVTGAGSWQPFTYYTFSGCLVDTQFGGQTNIWQIQVTGKSGTSNPFTSNPISGTTTVTDGTITWKCVASTNSGDSVWTAHTSYASGHFIVQTAAGKQCLFQLQPIVLPFIRQQPASPMPNCLTGTYVTAYYFATSGNPGAFTPYGAGAGSATVVDNALNSVLFNVPSSADPNHLQSNFALNNSGELTTISVPYGNQNNFSTVILFYLDIPQSLINAGGQATFSIPHDDGMFFGIGAGAISGQNPMFISGPKNVNHSFTSMNSYPVMGGNDLNGAYLNDQFLISFPVADLYPVEIDYFQWENENTLSLQIQGFTPPPIATGGNAATMSTPPVWPGFSTNSAPSYSYVTEQGSANTAYGTYSPTGGLMTWYNLGPIADDVWKPSYSYTGRGSSIIDTNGNQEAAYEAGYTGASNTQPNPWKTLKNDITADNPNLLWINQGPGVAPPPGTLSTFNGGWKYSIALVNSLDNTVSNATTLSAATGNFKGVNSVNIPAGSGLPPAAQIDPQADYVAIFRTTDGLNVPFLIPGNFNCIIATLPLSQYLVSGFSDIDTDPQLNNLIQAPLGGENTPPAQGATALVYHLDRIFFAVGNVVYWTSGSDTPIGNGVNGVSPLNNDTVPSNVVRLIATAIGVIVITVSDIYLIPGQGTAFNPIQPAFPYLQGVGALSYDAVDVNGSRIGLFSTDSQFLILDASSGLDYAGQAIGDKFRLNNGSAGTSWNPALAQVTWHSSGEDAAWYVCDGVNGWYRMNYTPTPESSGVTWSPFAKIGTSGCTAIHSVEVSPGTHKLLSASSDSGNNILSRDLTVFSDHGQAYSAFATLGSLVLVQPGQLAIISFITVETIRTGTPMIIGVLMDEVFPYYTKPFITIKDWKDDPTDLFKSSSIFAQRFYLSDNPDDPYVCRHMQIKLLWNSTDTVQNELFALTVFGGFLTE